MIKAHQPPCPECERLSNVADDSNKIGEFIDWLRMNEMDIVEYDERGELRDYPSHTGNVGINNLLAKYFGIDLNKVEQERRALLDWLRSQHEEN